MSTEHHKKLLRGNVTKTYKKAPPTLQRSINPEAKLIATKLTETPVYVSLKDHKDNFRLNPLCHLTNPSRSEISKVNFFSRTSTKTCCPTLNTINEKYQRSHPLVLQHQQKAELQVHTVGHKKRIYLPITEETSNNEINFAENHISISQGNIRIIKHCNYLQ